MKSFVVGLLMLLGCSLVFSRESAAVPLEILPEVEAFQKNIETTLNDGLRHYLGNDAKFAAQVYVRRASAKSIAAAERSAPTYDVGYVKVPFSLEDSRKATAQDDASRGFALEGVEVTLLLPEGLPENNVQGAKTLAEQLLRPYRPTVVLGKIPAMEMKAMPRQQKDLTERLQPVLLPAAAVMVGIILVFGFLILSSGMRSSARAISDGLRVIFGNTLSSKDSVPAGEKEARTSPVADDAKASLTPESLRFQMRQMPRHIGLIKEILQDTPWLLHQCLGSHALDWSGCRWLLSHLGFQEQEQLLRFMSPDRRKMIQGIQGSLSPEESSMWLLNLVERLMIQRVQAKDDIRQALGSDLLARIYQVPQKDLSQAIRALNKPAGWRLAGEFLPAHEMSEIISSLPVEQWMTIADSASLPAAEIAKAATEVFDYVKANLTKPEGEITRKEFIKDKLLGSIIEAIQNQPPGEDDRMLADISIQAPDVAELIGDRIWTVGIMDRVPDAPLGQMLREYSYEKRVALLSGLPTDKSNRMVALLPEGNMRTVTLDMLSTLKTRSSPEDVQKGIQAVREFINELQKRAAAGQFHLAEDKLQEIARAA